MSVSDLESFREADLSTWLPARTSKELSAAVEAAAARVRAALDRLKALYHQKDALIDLLAISAVAGEPLLVLGPPGTGKSDLIGRWCGLLGLRAEEGGRGVRLGGDEEGRPREEGYFEYLLTAFTEPNELFGPVDVSALREGEGFRRRPEGMLQRARIAFLDEVFRANSAILNSLLSILNERRYYEGGRVHRCPLLTLYAASNTLPAAGELGALLDRFPLRAMSESVGVRPEDLRALLDRAWALETEGVPAGSPTCLNDLLLLAAALPRLFAGALHGEGPGSFPCLARYLKIVRAIRTERAASLSDRALVKLVRVLAAAALLSGSLRIEDHHLAVLLHVWERPEDREQLRKFIEG